VPFRNGERGRGPGLTEQGQELSPAYRPEGQTAAEMRRMWKRQNKVEDLGKASTNKKKKKLKQKAHVLLESYKLGSLENDLVSYEIRMFPFSLYSLS